MTEPRRRTDARWRGGQLRITRFVPATDILEDFALRMHMLWTPCSRAHFNVCPTISPVYAFVLGLTYGTFTVTRYSLRHPQNLNFPTMCYVC